jgi:hypothetical protein
MSIIFALGVVGFVVLLIAWVFSGETISVIKGSVLFSLALVVLVFIFASL